MKLYESDRELGDEQIKINKEIDSSQYVNGDGGEIDRYHNWYVLFHLKTIEELENERKPISGSTEVQALRDRLYSYHRNRIELKIAGDKWRDGQNKRTRDAEKRYGYAVRFDPAIRKLRSERGGKQISIEDVKNGLDDVPSRLVELGATVEYAGMNHKGPLSIVLGSIFYAYALLSIIYIFRVQLFAVIHAAGLDGERFLNVILTPLGYSN